MARLQAMGSQTPLCLDRPGSLASERSFAAWHPLQITNTIVVTARQRLRGRSSLPLPHLSWVKLCWGLLLVRSSLSQYRKDGSVTRVTLSVPVSVQRYKMAYQAQLAKPKNL